MVNPITTHSYLFIRWVFVHQLSENPNFPIEDYLHWGFFTEVFLFFTGRVPSNRRISEATTAARDLIRDHLGAYKQVAQFNGFDERSLGQIAALEGRAMFTAYMNNIRFRFKQHMDRIIWVALCIGQRKAALRRAMKAATDEQRRRVFQKHVHTPNRQVREAIRTGKFHQRQGLHPLAVRALDRLEPILSKY
ncbi:hypothetical protein LPJ81_005919, partial [Coemansia sp. IMI 209127]